MENTLGANLMSLTLMFRLRVMLFSLQEHEHWLMLVTFLFDNQGKSSQVPQFLLEENIEPILCTQPRRFAVVAVAKMVAKARNCVTGGEVGYHIGHSRVMSSRYLHYHMINWHAVK